VVGAGICGTITAYSYAKARVPIVVFERKIRSRRNAEQSIAKVNSESRPQIDPVFFRLPEDESLVQFRTGEF
jgi:flavin-dependent dehydrogenase